jgi:hypothetical protein
MHGPLNSKWFVSFFQFFQEYVIIILYNTNKNVRKLDPV